MLIDLSIRTNTAVPGRWLDVRTAWYSTRHAANVAKAKLRISKWDTDNIFPLEDLIGWKIVSTRPIT